MIDALTALINSAGWLAPIWYVSGYLMTALLPVIPTPLVAAIGGTAFGFGPAVVYGFIGMGLGAALSLTLARHLGRPLLRRFVSEATWKQWETLLGTRSYALWFLIFITLNMDVVVMASGLSSLSGRLLWATAMAARIPWLLAAAWFGDVLLVNDAALVLALLVAVPVVYGLNRARPTLQAWLGRLAERTAHEPPSELRRAPREDVQEPTVEPPADASPPARQDRSASDQPSLAPVGRRDKRPSNKR